MKEFYVTLLFWAVIRMFNVFPLLMCLFNMYNINSVSSGLVLSFAAGILFLTLRMCDLQFSPKVVVHFLVSNENLVLHLIQANILKLLSLRDLATYLLDTVMIL